MTNTNIDRILAGLAEVADIEAGRAAPARLFRPGAVDVRAIRGRTGLTQAAVAAPGGCSAAAGRDWDQRRREPEASARVLLTVIDREPDAVRRALAHT